MDKKTKITLDELIRRKEQMLATKKQKKTCELYVESLDGVITVTEPDRSLVNDCRNMKSGEGDPYLLYQCVVEPDLKSKALQEAYECTTPTDIVDKVFAAGEIGQISTFILSLARYNSASVQKITDEIKNS